MTTENLPEETVVEETVTETIEEKVEEKVEPQVLTEERVLQLMAEVSSKAKEDGKREMQGIKDREIADANRRTRLAQQQASSLETSFSGLDDETKKDIELAKLRGRDQQFTDYVREDDQRRQQEQGQKQFVEALKGELTTLGIDPEDKRIDLALDATNYFEGRKRFTDSVSKILKESQTAVEAKADERFKELERKLRGDLGLDQTDLSTSGGVNTSDSTFMEKYNAGDLDSPADHKRAKEILSKL